MGTVCRHTYTVLDKKTGRRVSKKTKKWYVEYTDPDGRFHRVAGYTDKKSTEKLLVELEQEAARVHCGFIPANPQLARVPLVEHLANYLEKLRVDNNGAAYIELVESRATKILEGCGFSLWADIDQAKLANFLSGLRATPPPGRKVGLAIRTTNHYLSQFRGFISWVARRMKSVDPLQESEPLNPETDRRHVRRTLDAEQFEKLITSTAARTVVLQKQSGPDRAMLYITAAYTGLRASELASLTPEQLLLKGDPPTVTVEAGYSKRRRQDTLPVLPALAKQLTAWLASRPALQPLWPGSWASEHHAAAMLRSDLREAGIPYRDARNRVFDFHALRGQFITGLALAGVSLVEAQRLARHSSPTLTSNFYTHLEHEDLARGLAKLPDPPKAKKRRRA